MSKSELLKDTIMSNMTMKKLNIIKMIVHEKEPVSLRLIEHFVTRYCKEKDISYKFGKVVFSPYDSYKHEQLRAFNKELFDVYRRTKIFKINTEKGVLETTVAQLNFFTWLFKYKILDYIFEHKTIIQKHVESPNKKSKKNKKDLSITKLNITIHFD